MSATKLAANPAAPISKGKSTTQCHCHCHPLGEWLTNICLSDNQIYIVLK